MAIAGWGGGSAADAYSRLGVDTSGTQWAQQAAAQQAAANQPRYAVGIPSGSSGGGPAIPGVGGGSSSASSLSYSGSLPNVPAPPTLQLPNAPTMPNFNSGTGVANQYDSQIQQLIAQLRGQASQSDSALADRANQQIAAQRGVLDRRADQDVQRSLAANGLLPTGGLAARMREQISRPYEEMLASSSAGINANLQQQRDSIANNLLSSVSGLQSAQQAQANEAIRLQQQAQMAQYQMATTQYEAQVRANETAYQRAMNQYQLSLQQQQAAQAQQRAQQMSSGYASSGGAGTSYGPAINAGQNSFLETGVQPRDLYNNMVSNQQASQRDAYNRAMAERDAAQQNRINSGLAGNGISSAGSYSGVSMNGPLVGNSYQASAGMGSGSGGYSSSGAYNTAMDAGSIFGNAANSIGGSYQPRGSYANSGYGQSMY